ncbi:hypothetical protein [Latilactobacillus fuchuensis]|uniref:Uncharacterized protein n=1 Tax=Latilactobacillus fuchuensis TaxID=164393 RepID=A0A2N9DXF3_9LACO|nr:hypothetical protein [Latilactobacillus fuchuensis]SPC39362.1 hypothetical protein LFUMFP_40046 [Latilactobacillus fuchuensis]
MGLFGNMMDNAKKAGVKKYNADKQAAERKAEKKEAKEAQERQDAYNEWIGDAVDKATKDQL